MATADAVVFLHLAQGVEEELQPIDLDLVDGTQHPAKLSLGESLSGQPHHIGFWQVNQQSPRVLAEGHPRSGQFKQVIRVEGVGAGDRFEVFWRHGFTRHRRPIGRLCVFQ